MYPPTDNVYIPHFPAKPEPITVEILKEKAIVRGISEDGKTGLSEVKIGMSISYCSVALDEDGKITGFVPKAINTYRKCIPEEEQELIRKSQETKPG